MTGTSPACRMDILMPLAQSAPVGASAVAGFAVAGHSVVTGIVIAAACVVAPLIIAAVREWFWLRALGRPARNFDRVCRITGGSPAETERLMKLLTAAENSVLTARTGHRIRDRRRAR